jgi:hypothetical protein
MKDARACQSYYRIDKETLQSSRSKFTGSSYQAARPENAWLDGAPKEHMQPYQDLNVDKFTGKHHERSVAATSGDYSEVVGRFVRAL